MGSIFFFLFLLGFANANPRYDTQIACEGNRLEIKCENGSRINLIRANFGRFSISICNFHGNLEWSVNCMSKRSFRVISEKCSNQPSCSLHASASVFGDPCGGVDKYLEVHYQCLPGSAIKTPAPTQRARPPKVKPVQPTSRLVTTSSPDNVTINVFATASSTTVSSTSSNFISTSTTRAPTTTQPQTRSPQTASSTVSTTTLSFPPEFEEPSFSISRGEHPLNGLDMFSELSTESQPSSPYGDLDRDYDSSIDQYSDAISPPLSDQLKLMLTTGCIFSIVCLFLTMLGLVSSGFHHSNKSSRLELQVKQNLTFCLMIVEVLFVIGIGQGQGVRGQCGFISSAMHYFFLAIFIWLFFDGFTLYLALLKQQGDRVVTGSSSIISCATTNDKPSRCYMLLAYGTPLVIHFISTLLDSGTVSLASPTSNSHCWLRSDKYFVLTFVGPVIAVLSANFLFLAITIVCSNYGCTKSKFSASQASASENGLKIRLRTSLTVFVVMSLSLTALFVSLCQELPVDDLVFKSCLYVFCVLNPTQVLVILVVFSSRSNSAHQHSIRVLTSLGIMDSKSNNSSIPRNTHRHNDLARSPDGTLQDPIIPRPHSSSLNLADVESPAPKVYEGRLSSDYGFRGNNLGASLKYQSPVYASSSGTAASLLLWPSMARAHIHTKHCLQFPCQSPHVVEHVYESIDEDPYIARLLIPISTPLIGRKASDQSSDGSVLPAIIRDNTNHSTIICGSSLTATARASNKVQSSVGQVSDKASGVKTLRHESTLI